ncbi:MAG: hypothetical protein ISR96_00540 [Nitrospira sp.]|nr:hypothetical protein [bacterium]MBL7048003.1 hypothetical protein [Nitrospira sp.]
MKRLIAKIFILTVLISFTGCTFLSHGRMRAIPEEKVQAIRVHENTKSDIVAMFGDPQRKVLKPGGLELYYYEHGFERGIGTPFFINVGRTSGEGQKLLISFQDDLVIDYEFTIDDRKMLDGLRK